MKRYFAAVAFAVALPAQSASAITFSKLTTIYIASGVTDNGAAFPGVASAVHCSNVSGQSAQVRVLVLGSTGLVQGADTETVAHGGTVTFTTHDTFLTDISLETGAVVQGVFNIESTQSAVFCSAMVVADNSLETGIALHVVRVNGHPGTVE
jgi:hypothetical protein